MSTPIQVSPATNDLILSMDQTLAEVVKVTIPKSGIVPKVDAYFLADTTSSMRNAINAVKEGISDVLTQIGELGADVQFGVGEYKDFPAPDPDPSRHRYVFAHNHSLSANTAQIQAAVNAWTVTGGRDVPEAQFYALDKLAEAPGGEIGWRADSRRIIIWFGDAAGHDAICQQISNLSYDITEASVTAKLVAEKIKVLALSLESDGAPQGLDDDPTKNRSDYYTSSCGASVGTVGQGTRIAKATGGKIVQGVSAETITETIINELAAQITAIGNVSLVASGETAQFVGAIAPAEGYGPLSRNQDHEISFDVSWLGTVEATYEDQVFTGSLDVVADGEVIGGKPVTITVPLDEEIPVPRPEDRSGNWMLIQQVSSTYVSPYGFSPDPNDTIVIRNDAPPRTAEGQRGHLWVLEKQTDGTYRIRNWETPGTQQQKLYLEAPEDPAKNGRPKLQLSSDTSLQFWVLIPVSNDPDTYAIQAKDFPDYALGTENYISFNGDWRFLTINRHWGRPNIHHYWRLAVPPDDAV
ncbi:MAG: hypothetical protein F6K09_05935 [Merismopedia sp. SIO2A8]|nr:hypothetical protein [Symploca sp. SIO2B6]NET48257.1 hypothetical protein [Merismopedia sp. SIO2A8]